MEYINFDLLKYIFAKALIKTQQIFDKIAAEESFAGLTSKNMSAFFYVKRFKSDMEYSLENQRQYDNKLPKLKEPFVRLADINDINYVPKLTNILSELTLFDTILDEKIKSSHVPRPEIEDIEQEFCDRFGDLTDIMDFIFEQHPDEDELIKNKLMPAIEYTKSFMIKVTILWKRSRFKN